MNKEVFTIHLDEASKMLMQFTVSHCFNELSHVYKYIIKPNSREPDKHLNEYESKILAIWNSYENHELTTKQVIELFRHDDSIPAWVNMSVYESAQDRTVIELVCSRRLRKDADLYHKGPICPFHLTVPLPPDSFKTEKDGKF